MTDTRDPSKTGLQEDIRTLAERARTALGVEGAGIAVVHNGEIILCEGLGVRDAAAEAPADAATLFAIGSSTKAFTTAAVAMLAEEGALDWDTPVRRYMPDFALYDPLASAEATARDMACHRVGLPRHEFSWYKSGYSRKDLVERLRYLQPSRPFRTTWQYQNVLFTTLGYLVEQITGKSWESFVGERILGPLGMARTNFSVETSKSDPNHATPYARRDGQSKAIPFARIDAIGPAGSINSCARDMAQWLRLQLGHSDGSEPLLSNASLDMMHRPQMVMPRTSNDPRRRAPAYGLGWATEVYEGHAIVHHGGNIDGFTAMVLLAPEHDLGVAVLCNQSQSVFPGALAYSVVDRVLDLPPRDWAAFLQEEMEKLLATARQSGDYAAERVAGTAPAHPLADYAGTYEHPAYGALEISLQDDGLQCSYHASPTPVALEHYHYDIFVLRAQTEAIPVAWRVPFHTALDGTVDALEIQFEPLTEPIVFRRAAQAASLTREELERFAGSYKVAGVQPMTVAVQGDGALVVQLPGQPPYTLVPEAPGRFALKGMPGFALQFDAASDGKVASGTIIQPNGIFPFAAAV